MDEADKIHTLSRERNKSAIQLRWTLTTRCGLSFSDDACGMLEVLYLTGDKHNNLSLQYTSDALFKHVSSDRPIEHR
jgi:hypothetical protein